MNWQDKTRGGYPVRNVRESGLSRYPISAEIFENEGWTRRTFTNDGEWTRGETSLCDLMPIPDWQEQALAVGWSPPDTAAYHRKTAEMLKNHGPHDTREALEQYELQLLAQRYPGEWG